MERAKELGKLGFKACRSKDKACEVYLGKRSEERFWKTGL